MKEIAHEKAEKDKTAGERLNELVEALNWGDR
jgi:hypothetical protein